MPITDFVELPKDFEKSAWFESFVRDEMAKLQKALEDLGQQLYRARITDEIQENRTKLVKNIQLLAEDLRQKQANAQIPKEKIIQFEKMICELNQYDQIVPQIMADLCNKASEYLKSVLALTTEFRYRCKKNLDNLKFTAFENDKAYQFEFSNIRMMDPQKVRVSRYNIVIRNEDLATLTEGLALAERVPKFFVEYLREKQQYLNLKKVQSLMVMKSDFFETLIPPGCVLDWNSIRFNDIRSQTSEYKGRGNTIFDKFSKIMLSVLLSAKNFILVEIKNSPDKEILLYDSDFAMFSIFHEKIIKCIRAFIIEELRDKADLTEVESIEIAKNYVGRSVNCPQVNYPHENGVYFLKNLFLCQQGKAVSPASYQSDQLGNFRLLLFSTLLRIGVNEDKTLPFDVLV